MKTDEEWRFVRGRAEQLFEEGDIALALKLMRLINRCQREKFEQTVKCEQKVVSTH